jgi:NADPH-dependent 2,4-dienoyl-CoA reductase/sulfur reductase-like enzyme
LRRHLHDGDEITLVARDERFFIGFAKLWDLAGMRALEDGTGDLHRLADHSVRYVHAEVTAIDPQSRLAETSEGALSGDALLVALGAGVRPEHADLIAGAGHDLHGPLVGLEPGALAVLDEQPCCLDGGEERIGRHAPECRKVITEEQPHDLRFQHIQARNPPP